MGRTEMIERFTRALVYIEREESDTQRREEMLRSARENFSLHLDYFMSLDLREHDRVGSATTCLPVFPVGYLLSAPALDSWCYFLFRFKWH